MTVEVSAGPELVLTLHNDRAAAADSRAPHKAGGQLLLREIAHLWVGPALMLRFITCEVSEISLSCHYLTKSSMELRVHVRSTVDGSDVLVRVWPTTPGEYAALDGFATKTASAGYRHDVLFFPLAPVTEVRWLRLWPAEPCPTSDIQGADAPGLPEVS